MRETKLRKIEKVERLRTLASSVRRSTCRWCMGPGWDTSAARCRLSTSW